MRTIKSLPEMAQDMEQELANSSYQKKRIYKTEAEEFKKEQLATDMNKAIETMSKTTRVTVKFNDPEDVRKRICDYFTACGKSGQFPSIQGLAVHGFGISRQCLNQWRNRQQNMGTESAHLIDCAADLIADSLTNQSLHNNANAIQAIFQLKNNHSFSDRVELQAIPGPDFHDTYFQDEQAERLKLLTDEAGL